MKFEENWPRAGLKKMLVHRSETSFWSPGLICITKGHDKIGSCFLIFDFEIYTLPAAIKINQNFCQNNTNHVFYTRNRFKQSSLS